MQIKHEQFTVVSIKIRMLMVITTKILFMNYYYCGCTASFQLLYNMLIVQCTYINANRSSGTVFCYVFLTKQAEQLMCLTLHISIQSIITHSLS